jgi:hypothetical protein
MVLLGASTGISYLFLLGFFLLFPALLVPSKPQVGTPPTVPGRPLPRRVSAKPAPTLDVEHQAPEPPSEAAVAAKPVAPPPVPAQFPSQSAGGQALQPTFSAPIFPAPMFPIALPGNQGTQTPRLAGREQGRREEDDEVLGFGALLALLKLAFG